MTKQSNAASKLSNLILTATISKSLSKPGGTLNLQNNANPILLTNDVVLQILKRPSLNSSKKLDFFRFCSLRHNYKHSADTYSQMLKTVCQTPHHHHNDIFELIASMKHDGINLDSSTFKTVLDSFIKCGKFDSALGILDHVEKDLILSNGSGSCLSPDVYTCILVALVRKNQVSTALSVFMKLLESGVVVTDAFVCNELLVGLRKCEMREEFRGVFEKLRAGVFPLDRVGYNICVHAFGCWGDLGMALSLFKEMREKGDGFSPDLCTYNSLIRVLCFLGKVDDALVVWGELKESTGLEPDEFTYLTLIQGCCKSFRVNDALKVYNEMQYNGVRADIVVYNSLLDGLLKSRKVVDACTLFERMVDDSSVRATCWTYNILIDGLYKNGRPEAAYTVFSDLKKKGNSFVDGITFSIVILHLCRENQLEEALQLVEEMEARGFVVDLVTITSLLSVLYRRGQWDSTERLMKYIRDGNLVPAILRWKSAMESSIKSPQSKKRDFTPMFPPISDISEVLDVTDSADRKSEDVEQPSDETDEWSSSPYMDRMANRVASGSHPSQSFSLSRGVRVMGKSEDSFDIDMVNTCLSLFLAKGKLSLACKLFEIFTDMGVDPVSYTYNSIMSSFVKKGYFKEAWGVLHSMGETVYPADIATYNVIIQGLGKMGRADLANAVLDKLMKEGGYLDLVMYNTLINALGKDGRIEEANRLFEQMKKSGINPDVVTYNTLIEVHTKAGRLKDAYKLLRMMLDAGCAPNHVTDTTLDFLAKEIEKARYQKASILRAKRDDPS